MVCLTRSKSTLDVTYLEEYAKGTFKQEQRQASECSECAKPLMYA